MKNYPACNELITCVSWTVLTMKVPSTSKAEFANTVDPDETAHSEAHGEPSHLDLQCLPSIP